ncbi:mannosyltransferase [Aquimarina sp. ERC-38]|uniref:mannosyltransferase n=1 Tax=Aquimarina sp. ERC-38 TaxID=2949996 RepID=UPI002245A358|nr:mannosyltransferase [Aquimarina sp. ERC-38]UZO81498.1 mannosyltransferase [Aquimarina sp. ERC-38]
MLFSGGIHKWTYLSSFLLGLLYFYFAYYIERTQFLSLFTVWTVLFLITYILLRYIKPSFLVFSLLAILFRLIFLTVTPNLSQDFYRFVWDGRMLLEGYNPYLSLPETWIANASAPIAEATLLYKGMGPMNGSHYTNYPPVSQFIYWLAALFDKNTYLNAMIFIRVMLILADLGTIWMGSKLLSALHLPKSQIFWYALNPFILIELTGNLHFEGVMVFFLITGLWFAFNKKWLLAGIAIGLSISVKLIPLLLLPVFIQYLLRERVVYKNFTLGRLRIPLVFYSSTLLMVFLTFLPFISYEFMRNFAQTINLWFQSFEFNASIYYIFRWIGYQVKGWNIIETLGPVLSICGIVAILLISFFKDNLRFSSLLTGLLFAICAYYAFATTVHPWYLAIPLVLSVFTRYRFVQIWSFCIIFSYTAYINSTYQENLWMVALEYIIVIAFLGWELFRVSKAKKAKLLTKSF